MPSTGELVLIALVSISLLCCRDSESPDENNQEQIVFDSPDWYVYTISADGTHQTKLIDSMAREPSYSSDGRSIAFLLYAPPRVGAGLEVWLTVLDRQTHTTKRVALVKGENETGLVSYSWSRDSRRIAFNRTQGGVLHSDICFVDLETREVTQVTHGGFNFGPLWSPVGNRIFFQRGLDSVAYMWSVNCDGTDCSPVPYVMPYFVQTGDWSRDGSQFVFCSYDSTQRASGLPGDLFRYLPASSSTYKLTSDGYSITPRFNLQATRLVYSSGRFGGLDLFMMNADGTGDTRLTTHGKLYVGSYKWSPDGKRVVYIKGDYSQVGATIHVVSVDGSGDHDLGVAAYLRCDWAP